MTRAARMTAHTHAVINACGWSGKKFGGACVYSRLSSFCNSNALKLDCRDVSKCFRAPCAFFCGLVELRAPNNRNPGRGYEVGKYVRSVFGREREQKKKKITNGKIIKQRSKKTVDFDWRNTMRNTKAI